jgi:hypothetical protein
MENYAKDLISSLSALLAFLERTTAYKKITFVHLQNKIISE